MSGPPFARVGVKAHDSLSELLAAVENIVHGNIGFATVCLQILGVLSQTRLFGHQNGRAAAGQEMQGELCHGIDKLVGRLHCLENQKGKKGFMYDYAIVGAALTGLALASLLSEAKKKIVTKGKKSCMYDYAIVGAGPTGLALALLLSEAKKKIVLIDRYHEVGGCHKVDRIDGFASLHSPMVASGAYMTVDALLKKIGLEWNQVFVHYAFQIASIGGKTLKSLEPRELFWMTVAFLRFLVTTDYGLHTSLDSYTHQHQFSHATRAYFDALCRLTDGAGMERYSLNEFLQLFNQQLTYALYQPRLPHDVLLWKNWTVHLQSSGLVDILLNEEVDRLVSHSQLELKSGRRIVAGRCLFAIPPAYLAPLLERSGLHKPLFNTYALQTSYQNYFPVIFHWDKVLPLPKLWGFPSSDWGVAFIVQSQYTDFQSARSLTVIAATCTYLDRASELLEKTVNQCTSADEVAAEVLRQLRLVFEYDLPVPTKTIVEPDVTRKNGQWVFGGKAFVNSAQAQTADPGVLSIGTHNGNSLYAFTSMESAMSNAVAATRKLLSAAEFDALDLKGERPWTVRRIVGELALISLIIAIGCVLLFV